MDAAYDDDFYKLSQYAYAVDEAGQSRVRLSGEAHHNHGFHAILQAWSDGGLAAAAARTLMQYEEAAPAFAGPRYTARYTDNHDEGRGLYRFGPGAFRAMNILAFLAPRTLPFLLTGQESGALNRPSIHARCQPCDKGRRILTADGREVRQEGVELEGNLFDRGYAARQQWQQFFKELIALRKKHRPLREGSCDILDLGEDAGPRDRTVLAFDRKLGQQLLRCVINLGDQPRHLARANALLNGTPLYGTLPAAGVLPPFSVVVVSIA